MCRGYSKAALQAAGSSKGERSSLDTRQRRRGVQPCTGESFAEKQNAAASGRPYSSPLPLGRCLLLGRYVLRHKIQGLLMLLTFVVISRPVLIAASPRCRT